MMTHEKNPPLALLKASLQKEVMMNDKPFSWRRVLHKAIKCPERRYLFWWRIASYLFQSRNSVVKNVARRINRKLIQKYGAEIQLGAAIQPGMKITHYQGLIINSAANIGHSFKVRQNTTIGITGNNTANLPISINIGNNVSIGASSCIIADQIEIGDNVVIGAMSFVNKDIPSNSTVITEKTLRIISHSA